MNIYLILFLSRCWEDLYGFLGIFFLAFGAFVQMFYLILNCDLLEFRHMIIAFETCFTIMLNKFDFGKIKVSLEKKLNAQAFLSDKNTTHLQETNGIAAFMFFLFAVSVSWILVNVMLTIIIDGYEQVKKELEGQKNDLEVIQYIKVYL